jgi:hypothetical protein
MIRWSRIRAAATAITLTLAIPVPVCASELVSGAHLAERCRAFLQDAGSEDGRFCVAYVRGFIDGSSNVVWMTPPGATAGSTESFGQRAARTRLGRGLIVRPKYCIDGSLGMTELVEQIVAVADERPPRDDVDAAALLYATFARFHQCD